MKKITLFGFLFILVLFQLSCDELGPDIDLGGGTIVVTPTQDRIVLIEEFTGVHCVNCPEGSELIEALKGQHGDRLIPISIHSGFFSNPFPSSAYDLRTPEGAAIDNLLGEASAWPAASVNRTVFDGESDFIVGKNSWAGHISTDLDVAPSVEVEISKSFNTSSRLLDVTVDLYFIEDLTEDLLISVIVTEDNIIDIQSIPGGEEEDYVHKHVLRGTLTSATGDAYTGTSNRGDRTSQTASMTLPAEWVEGNCEIVAFIHSAADKRVLQANAIHLVD